VDEPRLDHAPPQADAWPWPVMEQAAVAALGEMEIG
jgi:hypothetical protein